MLLRRAVWVEKVVPGLILISLWLDGWFFPLLLLPLSYILLVEKKTLGWLGFQRRGFQSSASLGALISIVLSVAYYPVFLYYLPIIKQGTIGLYKVFTDIFWYPLYEEVTYRGFALAHFADFGGSKLSARNLLANLSQSLLFLSIHKHNFTLGLYLVLALIFMLGLLNGLLFLKTRNIYGCIVSHSALNGFALILHQALT